MKKQRIKSVLIASIILSALIGVFGVSYAYYRVLVTGNENASSVITNIGALKLNFVDGDYINAPNILEPWTATKTITVTNTGTETVSYYLIWEELTNTLVHKELLTYTITNAGEGGSLTNTQIPNTGLNLDILGQTPIAPGVTHTYTITFNYEIISEDQSSDMEKVFAGKLKVVGELPLTLADAIKRDNPEYTTQVVTDDTMFQSIATTDMGLWTENRAGKTEDDMPVYFYRGDIDNNYVDFAGKMWRIVRINEEGSVKLILGGNSATDGYGGTTTTFNPRYSSATYVDYNHAANALRAANNTWYTPNLTVYQSYIADTKFCNDKSYIISGSDILYGAYGRLQTNKTPQYKCPNASDNYLYKIGALTADEVAYAGGLYNTNNASYYLYDNAQSSGDAGIWWLLSPSDYGRSDARVFRVSGAAYPGYLYYNYVTNILGFRPVVSLKFDTLILRGDGRHDSPYVITE